MFERLLIANRGEIACRIARTAQRLGIYCIAVYAPQDVDALHVELCDEAWRLDGEHHYLDSEKILQIAQQSNAQAIHPGYGFLSENTDFCQQCEQAGLVFIGPSASAMQAMGSKIAAKALMEKAAVPVTPGYFGTDQSDQRLLQEAQRIGFPLLIKASAGGGGRGMRIVQQLSDLEPALASCRREAASHFADDRLLLERFLDDARHIEIQLFADQQGHVIHLFERDCSMQRRYQKVMEEAPASHLSEALRQRMGQAAIDAARAIHYVGAGTVEFLLQPNGEFYFMEMNTRLQVEHAVTEMVCGVDLVEWQLRIASGEALPEQSIQCSGHAIEARIYAENTTRDFLPDSGPLALLEWPQSTAYCRIDSGVREGDQVSQQFDSMLAKLVVWGEDRAQAIGRLHQAISNTHILGVRTNLSFVADLLQQPAFKAGRYRTGFIEQYLQQKSEDEGLPPHILALAALYQTLQNQQQSRKRQSTRAEFDFPWALADAWRMNLPALQTISFAMEQDYPTSITVEHQQNGLEITVGGEKYQAIGRLNGNRLDAEINGQHFDLRVLQHRQRIDLECCGQQWRIHMADPRRQTGAARHSTGNLSAPMPAQVIDVRVAAGDAVKKGDVLMVLEAMKMEHSITAACDGTVRAVHFVVGDQVSEGEKLLEVGRTIPLGLTSTSRIEKK